MGKDGAQDSSWQPILTQQMWISFVLVHIFSSLRGKWWEYKKPNTWAFGCQSVHLEDVSLWKTPKVKWGHMVRDMQETSTSLMYLIGMWASFVPHVPSPISLYWKFDPRTPISRVASLAVLDTMKLASLSAQGHGEALPLLLNEPTLQLPRDLLAALRNGLHSLGTQEPRHLTAGLRKLLSLYKDTENKPQGSNTVD